MSSKILSLLVLSILLSGCSHVKIIAFDKQANTVSVQGGRRDSEEDVRKEAERYYGGSVELLNMEQKTVGVHTSRNAQAFGDSAYGSETTTTINRDIYTYSCKK